MRTTFATLSVYRIGDVVIISGFGRPFGLAEGKDGCLYVADMDLHAIARLSYDVRLFQWLADDRWSAAEMLHTGLIERAEPRQPGRYNGPHSVALSGNQDLYITTYYTPGLHIVSPDGSQTFGTDVLRGPATGHFDREGRVIVAEYALNSLVAFDASGALLGALGGGEGGFHGVPDCASGSSAGCFDRPHMCRALGGGDLIVADTWNHRLQRFSSRGDFFGWLGGTEPQWRSDTTEPTPSAEAGGFNAPVAVGIDSEDRILVTDWGNNRLQLFAADGSLMRVLNGFGLDRPYDAQFLGTRILGKNLAVADSHHGRVLLVDV